MKRLVLAIAFLAMPQFALAQQDVVEMLRSDLRADKVKILTAAMEFTDEEASRFWPIYREYDNELATIGDKRIMLIKQFAENYETLTDEQAKKLVHEALKLDEDRAKLFRKYFDKVDKEFSSRTAARFIQAERQINTFIDAQLAYEIPLVKLPTKEPGGN